MTGWIVIDEAFCPPFFFSIPSRIVLAVQNFRIVLLVIDILTLVIIFLFLILFLILL